MTTPLHGTDIPGVIERPTREQTRMDLNMPIFRQDHTGAVTVAGRHIEGLRRILKVALDYRDFGLVSGVDHGKALRLREVAEDRAVALLGKNKRLRKRGKRLLRIIVDLKRERDAARESLVEAMRIEEERRQALLRIQRIVEGGTIAPNVLKSGILRVLASQNIAERMNVPARVIGSVEFGDPRNIYTNAFKSPDMTVGGSRRVKIAVDPGSPESEPLVSMPMAEYNALKSDLGSAQVELAAYRSEVEVWREYHGGGRCSVSVQPMPALSKPLARGGVVKGGGQHALVGDQGGIDYVVPAKGGYLLPDDVVEGLQRYSRSKHHRPTGVTITTKKVEHSISAGTKVHFDVTTPDGQVHCHEGGIGVPLRVAFDPYAER